MDNIQFRRALDMNGNIIDISDIKCGLINKRQEFTCIGCGKKLLPRTGKIRTAHFYHYDSDVCSHETYLHKLGKQLFYEEFQTRKAAANSLILETPQKRICNKFKICGKTCTTRIKDSGRINLIAEYPEIEMEKGLGPFIPDLLIYDNGLAKFILIEIVVSNAPSKEKIDSGFPILQINAESAEDFDFIKGGYISESIPQVEIHNFPESSVTVETCGDHCQIDGAEKEYFETLFMD